MAQHLPTALVRRVAEAAHNANRAYCISHNDLTQPSWEYAPSWQRMSAEDGVLAIARELVKGPGDLHRNWMAHKKAEGWTWGPEKDSELKQHPCMVEFEELPLDQRMKDFVFYETVRAALDSYFIGLGV